MFAVRHGFGWGAAGGASAGLRDALLWGAPWPPPPWGALVRGALVGRCRPLSHLGVGFSRFSFSRGVKGFLSVLCRVSLERPGTQAGAAGDPSWAASSPGPPAAARPPEPPGSACGRRVRFSTASSATRRTGPPVRRLLPLAGDAQTPLCPLISSLSRSLWEMLLLMTS